MKFFGYRRGAAVGFLTIAFSLSFSVFAPLQAAQPDQDRYIVSFLDAGKGKSALRAVGATFELEMQNRELAAVRIPAHALKGLRNNPNIEYIEKDVLRFPMGQTTPWGVPTVLGTGVEGAIPSNRQICVIDSGYAMGHEDLPNPGNVTGTNVSGTGNWDEDSCFHGTHVAGTIAALNNDDGVVGVTDGSVGLHVIKVFDTQECAWTYSSSLIAALDECIAAESDIVSMSLGGPFKSRSEQRAFGDAANNGVLSIAAAGNDGNTRKSYPASYDSVMSVAAVDSAGVVADFSQQNDQVEIAAPGVAVRSTVGMGAGLEESLDVLDDGAYEVTAMFGSAHGAETWELFHCSGFGLSGECAGAEDKICLIERGEITFAEKVVECEANGGRAAVIYNNSDALFSGTLGDVDTSIPSVALSGVDGRALAVSGGTATVTVQQGNYAFYDGTSMATPHVSAVAALVWSTDTSCSNNDVRSALTGSARDLLPEGRDNATGFGLVQAVGAATMLAELCGGSGGEICDRLQRGETCVQDSDCCSNTCKGKRDAKTCK